MSVINTNVKSMISQNSMKLNDRTLSTTMERLSTGVRINSAKDDAAGLSIATRMTSDIRGMSMAIRNANDGISLVQTAEGALGEITSMLQRMRELSVQAANGTLTDANRADTQAEVTQLIAEIDNIASKTNFNNIKLLDGTASNINLQTNVSAGDTVTVKIDAVSAASLGNGSVSSLSATGFSGTTGAVAKGLDAGDLVLNGVTVGASSEDDDTLSVSDKASSAIAKVAAINAVSAESGVRAVVGNTVVAGSAMTAAATTGTIEINGVSTASITTTTDAGASRAIVVDAINAIAGQTGVRAVNTFSDELGVQLIADDGRNIDIAFTTLDEATTGVGTDGETFTGTFTLESIDGGAITVSTTSSGDITMAGVSAGVYESGTATITTTARAAGATSVAPSTTTTGLLNAGTLTINGLAIGAADADADTASSATATSSTKAASAIAIAAAINQQSDLTGVTAAAQANTIVGTSFTAAATTGNLFVNGVTVALTLTTDSTRTDVAEEINKFSGQTGVVASDNGLGLTLVAEDGRNIELAFDASTTALASTAAANLGINSSNLLASTTATAALAVTTYASVSLSSDDAFTLAAGSEGNTSFANLGFKTGTFGASEGGAKVADIDISTEAGATAALTVLDGALVSIAANRADLGAVQNRLTSAVDNLATMSTNLSESRSRIMDTDYATETTKLARSQIIQQAATAMLAQANQAPQSVLALLK